MRRLIIDGLNGDPVGRREVVDGREVITVDRIEFGRTRPSNLIPITPVGAPRLFETRTEGDQRRYKDRTDKDVDRAFYAVTTATTRQQKRAANRAMAKAVRRRYVP